MDKETKRNPADDPSIGLLVEEAGLQRKQLEAVFESAVQAIFIFDKTGKVLWLNPAGIELHGFTSMEDALTHFDQYAEVFEARYPDGRILPVQEWIALRALRGEVIKNVELRIRRKDTGREWVGLYSAVPVRDAQDEVVQAIVMITEITERKRAEEALRQSEQHYRTLYDTMLQGVVYQDAMGKVISMNPAAESILGRTPEEFLGESSVSLEHNTIREDGSSFPGIEHPPMLALRTGREVRDVIMGVYNPREKAYRWIMLNAVPLFRNNEDRPYQVYTLFSDITELKQADEALKAALGEKEVLLKELYHRTKNNLNVVSSLLTLQSRNIKDETVLNIFRDTQNRIISMALVHEKLYKSKSLSRLNIKDYISELANSIISSYTEMAKRISLELEIPGTDLSIDTATPVGLIINELMSNSLKYAFPDEREGKIKVSMRTEGHELELVFSDNGIGLPEDMDISSAKSLGLKLVYNLVRQIGGSVRTARKGGTVFIIRFRKDRGRI